MDQRRRPISFAILHVDADLLVVDKPARVLSVAGRGDKVYLPDLIRARPEFRPDEPLRVVHRLDEDASGVIVYARTLAAQRALVAQFEQRKIEKIYHALVGGYVAGDGEVNLAISFNKVADRVEAAPRRGKPALTYYRVLQRLAGNTWLECRPVTGRRHQIRVHLAAIGHPLTVDPLYGGGSAVFLSYYKTRYRPSARHEERPLIDRLTLHAARITLEHPATGQAMTFEAPLPKDLRATLRQLERLS